MAGNDIYDDRSAITSAPINITSVQARDFMREVSKQPTSLKKEWVVKDNRTGSRIYYMNR